VNTEFQPYATLDAGQILGMARVTAVDAAGWLSAVRTLFAGLEAVCLDVQAILGGENMVNGKVGQLERDSVDGLTAPR
jgi:hypothetical protein